MAAFAVMVPGTSGPALGKFERASERSGSQVGDIGVIR